MIDNASIIAEFEDPHRKNKHQQPKEHCEHEVVCMWYRNDSVLASIDGTRCMRNQEGCKECAQDTRSRPHPAPTFIEEDVVKEITDAFDRGYKVGFTEGQTDGTENEKLRAQDIARKAREDVLNKLTVAVADMGFPIIDKTNDFDDGRACAYGYFMRAIESLRSTQQQAGRK